MLLDNKLTVAAHNVRSLSKHVNDIASDDRIMKNGIIGFRLTQINLSYSTCKIIKALNFFSVNFNNKEKEIQ